MASKVRTHVSADTRAPMQLAPKHLVKQEFGRRLYQLMRQKGWHQSELARRAGIPRDSVSIYVRGRSLPSPANVQALAEALGVSPAELLPNHVEGAIDADMPAMEIKVSPNRPDVAWLRVNRSVTVRTAMKVLELLESDDAVDRMQGGNAPALQPCKD